MCSLSVVRLAVNLRDGAVRAQSRGWRARLSRRALRPAGCDQRRRGVTSCECECSSAGAQPYLGARMVSGDEMIDRVFPARRLRPLGLWRSAMPEGAGGRSNAGAGHKSI